MAGSQWRLEIRMKLDEELTTTQLDELMDAVANAETEALREADLARDPDGVTFVSYVDTTEPTRSLDAFWQGTELWIEARGLTGHVADGRAQTAEQFEAEALAPDTPELLSAPDVAALLGVSRQRVHQLHSDRTDFPAPYARLGSGPIWTRPAIEAFRAAWDRRPGRPARVAAG